MSADRMARVNALLLREIGDAVGRLVHDDSFNRAAATITRVETARNLRTAKVWVSVVGTPEEQQAHMRVLRRHRAIIQGAINADLHIKYTPVLRFELDPSLQSGDRVLAVLDELAHASPAAAAPEGDSRHE